MLLFQVFFLMLSCEKSSTFMTTQQTTTTTTDYIYSNMSFNDLAITKSINKIDLFPDIPNNYSYFDYKQVALNLDDLLYDFAYNPIQVLPAYNNNDISTWIPIGYWIDQNRQPTEYNPLMTGYLKRSFGLPTYVGDTRVISNGTEALTTIASVLSSSYAGIDKSNQTFDSDTYNFVEMMLANYDTGTQLVTNGGIQGQSFWYDIFPQILFARLYDMYDETEYMQQMVINGANQWLEALPYFVQDEKPYYDFVGYNVVLESPTTDGDHIEPPNGGLAFLFYSAYEITYEQKYLDATKEVLDYFQDYWGNPNYEALTDYAPYVAAILNYRYGCDYDIGKFIDFLFEEDSTYRSGWSVMNGDFGDYSVDGLVGQSNDYAFAMNSFHLASVLAPMVKYDSRYSNAIGKYFLNLVNNAKVFFPQEISLSHQTMNQYLYFDNKGSLCYEGFKRSNNDIIGMGMGDATTIFDIPSDLSIYSSAYIGMLGSIVRETDVSGILQLNLNITDSYGLNEYPYYLFYNPYNEDMIVSYTGNSTNYDLFETTTKTLIAKNVSNTVSITIPSHSSIITVELPANSRIQRVGNDVVVNSTVIAKYQASVNILELKSMQLLNQDTDILFNYFSPFGDNVANMKIYFDNILVYDGVPIKIYRYDKNELANTDYTMKVVITTTNGLTDYATKRVVCL